jgi:hypothetical protein
LAGRQSVQVVYIFGSVVFNYHGAAEAAGFGFAAAAAAFMGNDCCCRFWGGSGERALTDIPKSKKG